MLKWAHTGGKGNQPDNMKKMSFQLAGKSKKSFKTSGIPEPPSHTKAPPSNRTPPSNGSTAQSNGAPPSPSNSHTSTHSGGEVPRSVGQRTLEITLPAGNPVTATVDAKLQMMDLLVMIAAKNKLNPTGHVILPASADRTDISQFKASQRIGELDTTKLQIVPKLSRGEIISIRTSDKKKAAQFEQTVRLTVLSGKTHKALFRVNPEKPIQDFLPQVYEERGIEANECRLRLVKFPEDDIDYSKSLNYYDGVNELLLIDLRPPPPQEPELVPIEKKKKSVFGRKSKKKGEGETLLTKEAAPPEPSHAQAPVRQPSADSSEGSDTSTLKKRRPAPPPPPGGKKEPTQDGHLLKPSVEGVSRSAHGVSKKRRAPAPPPAGGAATVPLVVDSAPEVTVTDGSESPSLSDQQRHISFGATEVNESGSDTAAAPSPLDTPTDTPSSTLERKKDGGDAATGDDIQVEVSLAELDEVLDEDIPPPPDYAPPPPPVFDPPPPPEEPPSPGEPKEDVERLIQEGRLVLSPGDGIVEGIDTASECSSALTTDVAADQEVSVSEVNVSGVNVSDVNVASVNLSVPEDPESGEKVQIDSSPTNEDEDNKEADTNETQTNQSEHMTEDSTEETTDITEKRAALTRMMKLSLDEDSKETTSYSPTPQGEESDSMLEEKSLSALVGGVSREAVDDQAKLENEDKTKETEGVVEEAPSVQEKKEVEEEKVEEKGVEEKTDANQQDGKSDESAKNKVEQPTVEQLTEQYKQLQQQMVLLQQQLALNPTSASAPMQMNPAMTYQTQQMQQMQQQIILQQQMLMQQQQQTMGGYVMVPQPGGGMIMSPPQMMYTPMGMQPMPIYGQVTPPQAVSTPAVDQQDSPVDNKSDIDEADAGIKEESKERSGDHSDEVTPQETPLKPQSDAQAAPSGRRNVFADILKKKNAPKSSYVLSAQKEAQRQRSDSSSSLTSLSSKEGTAVLSVDIPKLERTESSPSSPPRNDSLVANGLSPTLSKPSVSSVDATPTSPSISTSLSNNSSPNESNNNTTKTIAFNVETMKSEVPKDSTSPTVPTGQGVKKIPPTVRPKPLKGPRPFRPASMYARVSAPENQDDDPSTSHARRVTDLRSMFMLGK